jgi:phospholipase C
VTIGAGSNGAAPPSPFTDASTGEGSTSMGFYNVQQGDAPYLKALADTYTMSDNYHQAVNGGHQCQPYHARHWRRDVV